MANVMIDTELQNTLKRVYENKIKYSTLNTSHPLLSIMKNGAGFKDIGSGLYEYAIAVGLSGNAAAVSDAKLTENGKQSKRATRNPVFSAKNIIVYDTILNKDIKGTQNTTHAYVSAFANAVNAIEKSHRNLHALMMVSDGTGFISEFPAGTYTPVNNIVTITGVTNIMRFERGLNVDLFNIGTTPTLVVESLRVVGVDKRNKTLTLLTTDPSAITIAGTGKIAVAGSVSIEDNKTVSNQCLGLGAWVGQNDNVIGGIDRNDASNYWFTPEIVETTGTLTGIELREAFTETEMAGDMSPNVVFAFPRTVDDYEATLQDQKRFIAVGDTFTSYAGGYSKQTLTFDGYPLIRDRLVEEGAVHGTSTETWDKLVLSGFEFMDDGSGILRVINGYGYELKGDEYTEYCNFDPSTGFTIRTEVD